MMSQHKDMSPDFLAVGEGLVDLISQDLMDVLDSAAVFNPYAGGQPSNICAAVARLGKSAAIAACVGDDAFGRMYREQMQAAGVHLELLQKSSDFPTTTAVVSRNLTTPDFMIFRGADSRLTLTDALMAAAANARIFHTSAFALARNPARDTILSLMDIAKKNGARITFDPNYHPLVWPDSPDFKAFVLRTIAQADYIKPSIEDVRRLFGDNSDAESCALHLLDAGAGLVVLTMGEGGTLLAYDGAVRLHIPSQPAVVVDVTGAGDSFWAGFISGILDGQSPEEAACLGQVVAEMKIGYTGPLRPVTDLAELQREARTRFKAIKLV